MTPLSIRPSSISLLVFVLGLSYMFQSWSTSARRRKLYQVHLFLGCVLDGCLPSWSWRVGSILVMSLIAKKFKAMSLTQLSNTCMYIIYVRTCVVLGRGRIYQAGLKKKARKMYGTELSFAPFLSWLYKLVVDKLGMRSCQKEKQIYLTTGLTRESGILHVAEGTRECKSFDILSMYSHCGLVLHVMAGRN